MRICFFRNADMLMIGLLSSMCFAAGPEINVTSDHIKDLYTFGEDKRFVFLVNNSGDEDLVIEKIVTTCGCMSVTSDDDVIPKGASTRITGVVKSDSSRDLFVHRLLVKSNAVNEPEKRLTVSGGVYPPKVKIAPKHIEIANVIGDYVDPITVKVQTQNNMQIKNWKIETGEDAPSDMIFSAIPVESKNPNGRHASYQIKFHLPKVIGRYDAKLVIRAMSEGKRQRITIPITAHVVEPYRLLPPEVLVLLSGSLQTARKRCLIKHRKGEEFSVISAKTSSEYMKARAVQNASGSYFLYLDIDGPVGLKEGDYPIQITMVQNGKECQIEYPVRVRGKLGQNN